MQADLLIQDAPDTQINQNHYFVKDFYGTDGLPLAFVAVEGKTEAARNRKNVNNLTKIGRIFCTWRLRNMYDRLC